jgi:hypothetical protein
MSDEVRHYDYDYVGGRKIGLERVKDQETHQEQENHNFREGLT